MNKIERIKKQNNIIYFADLRMAAMQSQCQELEEQRQRQKKNQKKYLRRLRKGLRLQRKKRIYFKKRYHSSYKLKKHNTTALLLQFGMFADKDVKNKPNYQLNYRP